MGGVFGALSNLINGAISPTYFVKVLGWDEVSNIWRASIAQGLFEGLIFGFIFSLLFVAIVGIISHAACRYQVAFKYLLGIVGGAFLCWMLGGLVALILAALSPEFYRHTFVGVPQDFREMLRYAWVGGSIWGAELGGLISLVISLVLFRSHWRSKTTTTVS